MNSAKDDLKYQLSRYTSEELLQKRGLGDGLSDDAHAAIEEIFGDRDETLPPKPNQPIIFTVAPHKAAQIKKFRAVLIFLALLVLAAIVKDILPRVPLAFVLIALLAYFLYPYVRELLVSEDAKVEAKNRKIETSEELTPLMIAAAGGNTIRARELLDYGADVNKCSISNNTALMFAARNNHLDTIKILLDRGADPKIRTVSGSTATEIAIRFGNLECADALRQ